MSGLAAATKSRLKALKYLTKIIFVVLFQTVPVIKLRPNWNAGILEQWNNGLCENGAISYYQNCLAVYVRHGNKETNPFLKPAIQLFGTPLFRV